MTQYMAQVSFRSAVQPEPADFRSDLAAIIPTSVQNSWAALVATTSSATGMSQVVTDTVQNYLRNQAGYPDALVQQDQACQPCPPPPKGCHTGSKSLWEDDTTRLEADGSGIDLDCSYAELTSAD